MSLLQQSTYGATFGRGKKCYSIAITNQYVIRIWQKGSTRQPEIMVLVHMSYFCAAHFDIHVTVTHIAGTTNIIADALPRSQIGHFKQLAPNAADVPNHIPAWPTQFWTDYSFSTNRKVLFHQLTGRTKLGSDICYFVTDSLYHPSQFPHSPCVIFAHILLVMCLTRQSRLFIRDMAGTP